MSGIFYQHKVNKSEVFLSSFYSNKRIFYFQFQDIYYLKIKLLSCLCNFQIIAFKCHNVFI